MHILFLTDNFPPEVNAPASRTFEHCREWVKSGHRVTVITCAPNFPKGSVYEGYRNRLWQCSEMDGIKVIRVWSYISSNQGFVKRILDYMSYMMMAIFAAPFVRRVDLVVGTSPQFFTVCAAYIISRYKFVPFVFELRDLWPESIKTVGAMKDSFLIRMLERIELFLYKKATLIVSVTHSFKETLITRGVDRAKIEVITNGVDLSRFRPIEKDKELVNKYGLKGKFVAGYIGTHGMAHSLETVIDAAKVLQTKLQSRDFRLILLGDGARKAELKKYALKNNISNVIFINTVNKDEVVRYWSLLDVAIIHLKKTDLFKTVIPSKLFECMGMGIPVLHGVHGESADIVENEEVGLVFEPENSDDLVEKLIHISENNELYSHFVESCKSSAEKYERSYLAEKMIKLLEALVLQNDR